MDVVVDQEAAVPGRVKLVESVHHRSDHASGGVDEAVVPAAVAGQSVEDRQLLNLDPQGAELQQDLGVEERVIGVQLEGNARNRCEGVDAEARRVVGKPQAQDVVL